MAEQAGRVDSGTQERQIVDSVPAVTRDRAIATVGHVFGLALTEQDKHAALSKVKSMLLKTSHFGVRYQDSASSEEKHCHIKLLCNRGLPVVGRISEILNRRSNAIPFHIYGRGLVESDAMFPCAGEHGR